MPQRGLDHISVWAFSFCHCPFVVTVSQCFYLGHGACARFFRERHIPLMMLGGGGYTPRNVARCWTYETSIAVDMDVSDGVLPSGIFLFFEVIFWSESVATRYF